MSYATNKQWAERSGLGLRIVNENIGTGTGSATSFDLNNDNIIADTYVLNHAASGSNDFTALTETTHYTLVKESGMIELTGAGVTAVGTDIIYATYWYTDEFSDSVITDLLTNAHSQVDIITGKKWDTPTSIVEYRNGRASSTYPTTDEPYQGDWDAPDFIVLKRHDVTKVDAIYYLNNPQAIAKFFNYDAGTTTYTDKTDAVNSSAETPFTLFDASPATGDYVYIGSAFQFLGLEVNLSTVGVDSGSTAIDWEYWNGSAWTDITETDVDTGASIFTVSGKFTWEYPYGWTKNSVNSSSDLYWIRGALTDNYSTDPVCGIMSIVDSVHTILEPRQWAFRTNGILNFMNTSIPNGTNNLRIDYYYGETTTPDYIEQLTVLIASIEAFIVLTGGSYNDATSYTLGSKSVTIGEQYVNIREVLNQYNAKVQKILDMIGARADVIAI